MFEPKFFTAGGVTNLPSQFVTEIVIDPLPNDNGKSLKRKTVILAGPGLDTFDNETLLSLRNSLKNCGEDVVTIGDASSELGLEEITQAYCDNGLFDDDVVTTTIIVSHGKVMSGKHHLYFGKHQKIPSEKLISSIAGEQGLYGDVVMLACYGGHYSKYEAEELKLGQVITFCTEEQKVSHFDILKWIDRIGKHTEPLEFTDYLYLRMLHGHDDTSDPTLNNVRSQNLFGERLESSKILFSNAEKEAVVKRLRKFISEEQILLSISLMEEAFQIAQRQKYILGDEKALEVIQLFFDPLARHARKIEKQNMYGDSMLMRDIYHGFGVEYQNKNDGLDVPELTDEQTGIVKAICFAAAECTDGQGGRARRRWHVRQSSDSYKDCYVL